MSVIQEKALLVRGQLMEKAAEGIKKQHLHRFAVSKGWVTNFTKRQALRSVSLWGEADSANAQSGAAYMSALRQKLRAYDIDFIFNMDETGPFYKLLPRRTYVSPLESRKVVRSTKAMTAKDRATAYVCTNADGTAKLPMAIIGKPKSPPCFRLGSPPVPYMSQIIAWSDSVTFRRWLLEVLLPFVRKFTSRKCVLIMDNCSPHGTDVSDIRGKVDVLTLSPNCTSIHQPMDMGIIAAFKKRYRELLLRQIVKGVESRQQKRLEYQAKRGLRWLADGFDPHLLDVCRLVEKSWKDVSVATIARCWVNSNVLPACYAASVNDVEGKISSSYEDKKSLEAVVQILSKLNCSVSEYDPLTEQLYEYAEKEDIERWFTIGDDLIIKTALV